VVECTQLWPSFEDESLQYFDARSIRLRHEIELVQHKRSQLMAEKYELKSLTKADLPTKPIELSVPNPFKACNQDYNIDEARLLALENLHLVQLPYSFGHLELKSETIDILSLGFQSMSGWISDPVLQARAVDLDSAFLISRTVETFFYRHLVSRTLIDRPSIQPIGNVARDCKCIEQTIDKYRLVVSKLYTTESKRFRSLVDLRSRELLVVWAGYCLVHKLVSSQHPILLKYRPALDPDDLQYLVLSDRLANDALRQIAVYLWHHAASSQNFAFSLRKNDKTFDLAREYARHHLMDKLSVETLASDKRKKAHWNEVREKQNELSSLDGKLCTLELDLLDWRNKFDRTVPPRGYRHRSPTTYDNNNRRQQAESMINSLDNQISSVKSRITAVERPPAPVLQPLPRLDENALPILFFLLMPEEFQVLSRFSCLSPQMLLPSSKVSTIHTCTPTGSRTFDVSSTIRTQQPATTWRDYYLSHSSGRAYEAVNSVLVLGSEGSLPKDWHPNNVRLYSSQESGVWYPDQLTPKLYWGCNNSGLDRRSENCFNPFCLLPHEVLVHTFTEKVANQDIQWALEQHGKETSSSRGNWAQAALDINHASRVFVGKYEYLSFCALRAHPYQQIRKLCVALNEKTLPLAKDFVRVIILQALCQTGPIAHGSGDSLWQVDLHPDRKFGGWNSIHDELERLADEIEGKTREHRSLLTLGLVAAYSAQWHAGCRDVSRKFAKIARTWADDLASGMKNAKPVNIPILRARACLFHLYSILCYGGNLSLKDVGDLCELSLLAESCRFFEEKTDLDDEVKALNFLARDFLANKMESILPKVQPQILTRAVDQTFEGQEFRCWRRVKTRTDLVATTCFEAITGSGHLLSVNVLTGALLYDGLPPRRLPASITSSGLYKRTFRDHNFDVFEKDGTLETTRLINDRTYSFSDSNGRVVISEHDTSTSTTLELMDGTHSGVDGWGRCLPLRLAQMHSHWLCRERDVLVLRPPHFDDFDVHFILKSSCPGLAAAAERTREGRSLWKCYRVPSQRRREHWLDLLGHTADFDELTVIDPEISVVLPILQKFEDMQFIHYYLRDAGKVVLEFPRYGLEFDLEPDGRLHSRNFEGFFLRGNQRFLDTLYGFEQYLILEAEASHKQSKVLIPSGQVVKNDEGIRISVAEACYADLKYHVYEIHHRLNTIDPLAGKKAIEARLQLACLHAASPSCLPESRSLQTGGERAIELVRQCFVNRPLSGKEHRHLRFLSDQSEDVPALSLLSTYLDSASRELHFLHPVDLQPQLPQNDVAATHYTNLKMKGLLASRSEMTDEEEEQVLGAPIVRQWRPGFGGFQDHCEFKRKAPFSIISVEEMDVKLRWRSAFGGVQHFRGEIQISSHASGQNLETKYSISSGHKSRSIIQAIATELKSMILCEEHNPTRAEFPFEMNEIGPISKIASETFDQLVKSWGMHRKDPCIRLSRGPGHLSASLTGLHAKCKAARMAAEAELIHYVSYVPSYQSYVALGFSMRRSVNLEPVATVRDLLVSAGSKSILRRLNPALSDDRVEHLHAEILQFLCLCVLEDKLERMTMLASTNDSFELKRELLNVDRSWDVNAFPCWLAFEVEQR
jgi:hypothetical protein